MTDPAIRERGRIVAWLFEQSRQAMWTRDKLWWWRFRLRFANQCAAAACLNLAGKIQRGDHHTTHAQGGE